jgi:hypothetical protein
MHSPAATGVTRAARGPGTRPPARGPAAPDPVLEVDVAVLVARLAVLPDEMNPVLRLADGRRTRGEIVRERMARDPEAPSRVEALCREGILRVVGARSPPPALAGAPPPEPTGWFVSPEEAARAAPRGLWGRVGFPVVALGLVALAVAAAVTLTRPAPPLPVPTRSGPPVPPPPAVAAPAPVAAPVTAPAPVVAEDPPPASTSTIRDAKPPRPVPAAPPREAAPRSPGRTRTPPAATAPRVPPPSEAEVAATYRAAIEEGARDMERGAHLAAAADYRRALAARATGEAWFGLGQALAEAGRPDEAREAFRRCLGTDPRGPHAGEAVRAMRRLR